MADFYGSTYAAAKSGSLPQSQPDGALVGGKLRCITEVITYAAQASGSRLYAGQLPIGAVFAGQELTTSVSTASATLSSGSTGAPAKYKAAAAFTAVDTPTPFGPAAAMAQAPLTAPEDVYLTTGGAALPASGTLVIKTYYTTRA